VVAVVEVVAVEPVVEVVEDLVVVPEVAVEAVVVPQEVLEEVLRSSLNLTDMLVSLLLVERKIF
jgi:predicted nucleotidyltransferase